MKSGPHLPQLGKDLAQKRRPNTAIKKKKKIVAIKIQIFHQNLEHSYILFHQFCFSESLLQKYTSKGYVCSDMTWNIVHGIKKTEPILFLPRGNGYINYGISMWCNAKKEAAQIEK